MAGLNSFCSCMRKTSSPNMEFAHANHSRVNAEGWFGSKLSCMRAVPAWVVSSMRRILARSAGCKEVIP